MLRIIRLFLFFSLILSIFCHSSNFINNENENSNDGYQENKLLKTNLPLIMRTLRLRPFFSSHIYHKQLRLRPYNRLESSVDNENSEFTDETLPGYKLIGRHRRPRGPYRHRVYPLPVKQRIRTLRNNQVDQQCTDEHNKILLKCFKNYFNNFNIDVDDKLPSLEGVYERLGYPDYNKNQVWVNEFKKCYKSLPESCFHFDNFNKIAHKPNDDGDAYVLLITTTEYMFIDTHHLNIIDCFSDTIVRLPTIHEDDTDENKKKTCKDAQSVIDQTEESFMKNCKDIQNFDDEYKEYFILLVKRLSVGYYCPAIKVFQL